MSNTPRSLRWINNKKRTSSLKLSYSLRQCMSLNKTKLSINNMSWLSAFRLWLNKTCRLANLICHKTNGVVCICKMPTVASLSEMVFSHLSASYSQLPGSSVIWQSLAHNRSYILDKGLMLGSEKLCPLLRHQNLITVPIHLLNTKRYN